MSWLNSIQFTSDGLIPAIAQDYVTGRILMMAWMNRESLELTLQTNTAVYYSRSRQKIWHKGETSGHTQKVHSIHLDCDADVIVLKITQIGGISCHTGRESCFYKELDVSGDIPTWKTVDPVLKDPDDIYKDKSIQKQTNLNTGNTLQTLDSILEDRKQSNPESSYVANLYSKGLNKILEKVGEESFESVIAAKDYQIALNKNTSQDEITKLKNDLVYEIADVWFHTMVTLAWFNMCSDDILSELSRRFGISGIEEKANRSK